MGYGGPCFPRDSVAIASLAARLGVGADLALATDAVNRRQAARLSALVHEQLAPGREVTILGLAYKPQTPVVEESQGLDVGGGDLAAGGARVTVRDPLALENCGSCCWAPTPALCRRRWRRVVTEAMVIVIATPRSR